MRKHPTLRLHPAQVRAYCRVQGLTSAALWELTIAAPSPDDRLLSLSCSGSRLTALWSGGTLRCYGVSKAATDAEGTGPGARALEMRLKGFCIPSGQQVRCSGSCASLPGCLYTCVAYKTWYQGREHLPHSGICHDIDQLRSV